MSKHDLNKTVASLLTKVLTLGGLMMFVAGLLIGFLIAVSPFVVIGLVIAVGIVLYAFRDKINFKTIREQMRSIKPVSAPNPLPSSPTPAVTTEAKKEEEEKKKKRSVTVTFNEE